MAHQLEIQMQGGATLRASPHQRDSSYVRVQFADGTLSARLAFGKAALEALRARAPGLQPPASRHQAKDWLKAERAAYKGTRASSSAPITACQREARQKTVASARSCGVGWQGCLDLSERPFVRATLATRGVACLHQRALPSYTQGEGAAVHVDGGQRTKYVVMTPDLKPPPENYTESQLYYPTASEANVLRNLMERAAKTAGRNVDDISEIALLLGGPGCQVQKWHQDAVQQFLAVVYNASDHPVPATEFVDAPPVDFSFGILGQAQRRTAGGGLSQLWAAAASGAPPLSASLLAPGDAIYTHPLHPHRGVGIPPLATPRPVTESDLRRIVFLTFGKAVSSETTPIFSEQEFRDEAQRLKEVRQRHN
jgi:hypothetical protein